MDGVPDLTQPPIRPGESLTYRFTAPDAGTYCLTHYMSVNFTPDEALTSTNANDRRCCLRLDRGF